MKIWVLAVALAAMLPGGATGLRAQYSAAPAKHSIYPEAADPRADIAKGLAQAKREHKRVLLDFGGDWCGDCQVLDIYFHQPLNSDLLTKNFVLVHVFINETMDNADHVQLALRYGVPIAKGVPALAVLDANGTVLYSQKTGQFNSMRNMDPGSVNQFLNRWKG